MPEKSYQCALIPKCERKHSQSQTSHSLPNTYNLTTNHLSLSTLNKTSTNAFIFPIDNRIFHFCAQGKPLRTRLPLRSLLNQPQKLHLLPKGESNHCSRPESVPGRRRTTLFGLVRVYRDVVYVPLKYPSRIIWWGGITLKLPLTLSSLH